MTLKHFQILLSKKNQTCYLDFYQMHMKHLLNAKNIIQIEQLKEKLIIKSGMRYKLLTLMTRECLFTILTLFLQFRLKENLRENGEVIARCK